MTRFSPLVQRLFFSILVVGTGSVWAQPPPPKAAPAPSHGNRDNLPDSVRRVERETGGEVLRAEPMQRDGHEVYRLKVLTADGRVRVVQADPGDRSTQDPPAHHKDKEKWSSNDSDGDPP